ncbi:MAG: hypothetical protein SH868_12805 [Bythopirellula sp.]|nr:hypothetical protein [Bythopirellula sp.]
MAILVVLASCLLATPASAVIIPGIEAAIPVSLFEHHSGLRYRASGNAKVFDPITFGQLAADAFSEQSTEFSNDVGDTLNFSDAAIATAASQQSVAGADASAGDGKLRAGVFAEGSTPFAGPAQARVTVEFVDRLVVSVGGDFGLTHSVRGSLSQPPVGEGSAFVVSEVWVFDGFAPDDNEMIGHFYSLHARGPFTPVNRTLGLFGNFPTGAAFWVYARVSVFASRLGGVGFAGADFTQTIDIYIDPSPATPGASITSASGHDYRTPPVPEPSSMALAFGAFLTSFSAVRIRSWRQR